MCCRSHPVLCATDHPLSRGCAANHSQYVVVSRTSAALVGRSHIAVIVMVCTGMHHLFSPARLKCELSPVAHTAWSSRTEPLDFFAQVVQHFASKMMSAPFFLEPNAFMTLSSPGSIGLAPVSTGKK